MIVSLNEHQVAKEPTYELDVQEYEAEEDQWADEEELIGQEDLEGPYGLTASEFVEAAFRIPMKGRLEHFSFDKRRYLRDIYDSPAQRKLLMAGRQVEKSTLLGNIILCYMSLVPSYKALYVSPSATQTKTFSNDRIKEPIETSPVLKRFTTTMLSQNIFEKQFVNRSKVTLRYAYLNADRTRGIPAFLLAIDEYQDVLQDNVPVIQQCLSFITNTFDFRISISQIQRG